MSFYREIRCDSNISFDCCSSTNKTPQGFQSELVLNRKAALAGWQIKNGLHSCPNCRELQG